MIGRDKHNQPDFILLFMENKFSIKRNTPWYHMYYTLTHSLHIKETSLIFEIRLKSHQNAFYSRKLKCKIVAHALQTDHFRDFEMAKAI